MTEKDMREMTEYAVNAELAKLSDSYMAIYDLYYSDRATRDSAFLKDLMDVVKHISALLEVYTRDNTIHPNYAIEKHKNMLAIINTNIDYFERKGE